MNGDRSMTTSKKVGVENQGILIVAVESTTTVLQSDHEMMIPMTAPHLEITEIMTVGMNVTMIGMSVEITIEVKTEVLAAVMIAVVIMDSITGINTVVETSVILVTPVVVMVDNEAVEEALIEKVGNGVPHLVRLPQKSQSGRRRRSSLGIGTRHLLDSKA